MFKEDEQRFKPSLGLLDATAISIGAIVGGGIFVVTGIVAGFAGPALVISLSVAAVIALFTALSFAELSFQIPREGSVYEFAYQLISPFAGFLTGWMWMLSNIFGGAAVSLGFAYYLAAFFPFISVKVVAVVICIFFTLLNFLGIRQSAMLNNALVLAKLLVLLFFVFFGLMYVNPSNFTPFFSPKFGLLGVIYGAFYAFFSYGGFGRVAVVAEEVKDAKHIVPKAILLSLAISTIFYILVGAVAVGLTGSSKLSNSNAPLTDAMSIIGNSIAVDIVAVGGLLATASVLLTVIMGISRVAYAMARRRDLPYILSKLHPKYNTPYCSIWLVGILITLLVLFVDLTKVISISTFALLFYYASANFSALKLRGNEKLYPSFVPALGAAFCIALLFFILLIIPQSWIVGVIGLALGVIVYFIKGKIAGNNS